MVHLYEEKGADGLQLLRGMFAFCIWDARKRTMLLVRDRFGKKPLYYANTPTGFYFGSELKCLRVAGVPLESRSGRVAPVFPVWLHRGPLQRISRHPQADAGMLDGVFG